MTASDSKTIRNDPLASINQNRLLSIIAGLLYSIIHDIAKLRNGQQEQTHRLPPLSGLLYQYEIQSATTGSICPSKKRNTTPPF
jgi:hypothetical protein